MSDMDKLAAEMREGLKHTTFGQWFVSGVRFKMSGSEWHSINWYNEVDKKDENIAIVGYDPRTNLGLPDAHHIARCNPVNIAALLDERAADKALMEKMADALEEHMEELEQYTSLESPGEKRAVAILAAYREVEGRTGAIRYLQHLLQITNPLGNRSLYAPTQGV